MKWYSGDSLSSTDVAYTYQGEWQHCNRSRNDRTAMKSNSGLQISLPYLNASFSIINKNCTISVPYPWIFDILSRNCIQQLFHTNPLALICIKGKLQNEN